MKHIYMVWIRAHKISIFASLIELRHSEFSDSRTKTVTKQGRNAIGLQNVHGDSHKKTACELMVDKFIVLIHVIHTNYPYKSSSLVS